MDFDPLRGKGPPEGRRPGRGRDAPERAFGPFPRVQ